MLLVTGETVSNYTDNKNFCAAPWLQLYVQQVGRCAPCCETQQNTPDIRNKNDGYSIIELMNSDSHKRIRKAFMNDEQPPECFRCFRKEAAIGTSMRTNFNRRLVTQDTSQFIENNTLHDGTLTSLHIKMLDVRFSNLCTLTCRMCGHEASSSFFEEANEYRQAAGLPLLKNKFIQLDIMDELIPLLPDVSEIYFAGGEPLIMREHYFILEELIRLGKTDVLLRYNSNLTSLKYKNKDILALWEKFDTVMVAASIDGIGDILEFQRTGSNWKDIEQNYNLLLKQDNIRLYISACVTVLNVEAFEDFVRYCDEHGWIKELKLDINIADYPEGLSIKYLPATYKSKLIEQYQRLQYEFRENDKILFAITHLLHVLTTSNDSKDANWHIEQLNFYAPGWQKLKHLQFLID